MKLLWIILIVTVVFHSNARGQELDTLRGYEYKQIADSLYKKEDYKEAITFYEKSLNIYEEDSLELHLDIQIQIISSFIELNDIDHVQKLIKDLEKFRYRLSNSDDTEIKYFLIKASFLKSQNKIDSAIFYYKKVIEYSGKNLDNKSFLITAYSGLGISYETIGEYSNAREIYDIVLKINEDPLQEAKILNNVGVLQYYLANYDSISYFLRLAARIYEENLDSEHPLLTSTYNNIGNSFLLQNNYRKGIEYYEKCLKIRLKQNNNLRSIANLYSNLGRAYSTIGRRYKGLEYRKKALELALAQSEVNSAQIASFYSGIANQELDWEGDLDLAELYLNKALEIQERIFKELSYEIGSTIESLGYTAQLKKDYHRARSYYQQALKIYNRLNHRRTSSVYFKLGQTYAGQSDYDSAIHYYKKTIDYHKNDTINHNWWIGYVGLTEAFVQLNNLDSAWYFANQVFVGTTVPQYESGIIFGITLGIVELKLEILSKMSKAELNRDGGQKILQLIAESIRIIEDNRKSIDNLKVASFSNNIHRISEYAFLPNNHDFTFNKIQISKSFILKTAVSKQNYYAQSDIDSLIDIETSFLSKLSRLKSKKIGLDKPSDIQEIERQIFDLNRQYDLLIEYVRKNYPDYHNLRYNAYAASIEEVQNFLNKNETLVEYFEGNSTLYAFVIDKNQYEVVSWPKPKDYDELLAEFKEVIVQPNLSQYTLVGHQLYSALYAPIDSLINTEQVIIVPDGQLWGVNFDLLLTQASESQSYQQLPYLLREHTLSYAYSATLLLQEANRKREYNPTQQLLAFSFGLEDSTITDGNQMPLRTLRSAGDDLPGSRQEIRSISELVDGEYYFGTFASEANFKKSAQDYKILHLAVHGETDDIDPDNSKLYFTPNQEDSIEDNYLHAFELYNMRLNADLAVLSACNTGTGKIVRGEGILSLGRAFTYAGAKSLLLSQWDVADVAAPEIMEGFYTYLKKGYTKSKALKRAKLDYLESASDITSAPFYWGSFYILGDDSAIDFDEGSKSTWYWIAGLVLVMAIATVYISRKKS